MRKINFFVGADEGAFLAARRLFAALLTVCLYLILMNATHAAGLDSNSAPQVKTASGTLQGIVLPSGIRSFRGIPYAQPPVGPLRWREPQPVMPWRGIRMADRFSNRGMQPSLYGDMLFRSSGMSEDCLYLNVWTPAHKADAHLPVLVYFYGGGFSTGDGSEKRYDGTSLATKGIVVVTVNYRLGIFGFFAHPELTKESPHHASGNYGLLDMAASLQWVHDNIATFGGDPAHVTIGGQSAGSSAVCLLMASPLSRNLIAGGIGESGTSVGSRRMGMLASEEQDGDKFAASVGAATLADLRAIPADELLMDSGKASVHFHPVIDGYFLPKDPNDIYAAGEQAHVPLLAGWTSVEMGDWMLLNGTAPTPDNVTAAIRRIYKGDADKVLAVYSVATPLDAAESAQSLACDMGVGYGTWKWLNLQSSTTGKPVYRYLYDHPLPQTAADAAKKPTSPPLADPSALKPGAPHSAEIAYVFGSLGLYDYFAWTADDYTVSNTVESYFANFIKTGNPNGPGLADWPAFAPNTPEVMTIDVQSEAAVDAHDKRYAVLEAVSKHP